ncbi:hypothetical protein M501DRAFT_681826 [Patellaria atrata CBS 101060]|uniref:BTB domain-containing protein n=1 Tax=Patellaria atrata CBS 101060 TaxID=1346257 RepID=A0A9P4SCQ5_9PEZI|nr:hypothetical protein M501DRAFT_681826 [Patellaria atrata CBS 101060]
MVSHPESTERALSLRRPPSIASHSSTVRRHRHGRSHHGGASYQPQNEFPVFSHTGDVEIVISNGRKEKRYLLHKIILTQCSGFFEASTSEEWSKTQGQTGPSNGRPLERIPSGGTTDGALVLKKRWRYELDWGNKDDEIPMLVQKDTTSLFGGDNSPLPPPVRNKPSAPQTGFFRSMANFSALNISSQPHTSSDPDDELFRDYENLLRVFYNYAPALDPINIAQAYVECKSLLQLADMYDALDVIGPRIDHHLLRFQSRLWKQIAKYPPSYLKLAYLARSRAIFSEALIHVVGQWPAGAPQLRNQVPVAVLDLIEDKVDELEELKTKIEGKLFRLTLTTSRGERVTPSNAWLDWLAMSFFRQWLAESTTPPPAPILKDSSHARPSHSRGHSTTSSSTHVHSTSASQNPPTSHSPPPHNTGRTFRLLGTGGASYLPHDELKRFLKLHPDSYTRDNLRRFERKMGYLVCTRVEAREMPWEE